MRKLLFPALVLITFNAIGQVAPPPPVGTPSQPPGERPEFIVAVQMGTDTLKNGEVTVNLTEQTTEEMKQAMANPNYTVMLTPRGDCGSLNLAETTATGFKVKLQKGSASYKGIFDYVVYAKQKRPLMPMRPKPPVPPAPPANGQPQPPQPPQQQ